MAMSLTPRLDYLLLSPIKTEEKKVGAIFVPDSKGEKATYLIDAVGPDATLSPGTKVLLVNLALKEPLPDGSNRLLVRQEYACAIVIG